MMRNRRAYVALGALSALLMGAPIAANAASILIDDSDLSSISIIVSDFQSFSIDGVPLANGVPLILPDGGYGILGTFIDGGANDPSATLSLLFAPLANPTNVTSGIQYNTSTDGTLGTVSGSFGGYGGSSYFSTALPTFAQDVSATVPFTTPLLSGSFISESIVVVPEPGTMALLAVAALPILLTARKRKANRL